jgi:hypothetical protein
MSMKRAGVALLLAGAMVIGASGVASASPAHPQKLATKNPACRAGLHVMRAQRGTFDWRYDHILVKGIIGTACANAGGSADRRPVCKMAKQWLGEFKPLFKTNADLGRAREVVTAACA